jgi:integrase
MRKEKYCLKGKLCINRQDMVLMDKERRERNVSNSGENIYQRKDGRWEGRYRVTDVGGEKKTKYRSVYGSSYHDVKERLLQAIIRQRLGADAPAPPMTVAQVTEAWMSYTRLKVRKATYAKYDSIVNLHILPQLGNCEIGTLELVKVQNYVSSLLKKGRTDHKGGLSEKTAKDILVILKSIFKYADSCGIKTGCRIDSINIHCQVKEVQVLSGEEQVKLSRYLLQGEDLSKTGIYLALYTGIRIGELAALQWGDIELAQKVLHIRRSLQRIQDVTGSSHKTLLVEGQPKTRSSVRDIPLTDGLVQLLAKRLEQVSENVPVVSRAYVMTGELHPMEPRTIQNRFKNCLTECGIADTKFHALRHSFASKCAEAGFDAKSLSEVLGHATVSMTLNRYVHSSLQQKRNQMERAMGG